MLNVAAVTLLCIAFFNDPHVVYPSQLCYALYDVLVAR